MENPTYPGENHWRDINSFIVNLDIIPTYVPKTISEQFVIVTNGGSARAYIYDVRALTWRYTSLT